MVGFINFINQPGVILRPKNKAMSNYSKETPRQKMIGMMYLVLTCLLALNVTKEVLEGFVTINESIEKTNSNFTTNTKMMMDAFDEAIKNGHHEAKPYYDKAKEV